jgi:hypothetical protein
VKDLVDEIIAEEFASPDLKLVWLDEDIDAAQAEEHLESRVKLGALTLNELRDSLGLDPFANAAADRPMVLTATGYVPIEANVSSLGGLPHGSMSSHRTTVCRAESDNLTPLYKYSPHQPRLPAGRPGGGQWTKEDENGAQYAAADAVHSIGDQVGEINAFAYYGVAGNLRWLAKVYRAVERYWRRMLCSRSWAGRRLTGRSTTRSKQGCRY